jgi:hypothetical protein
METRLFSSNQLIDEVFVEHGSFELRRTGRARYLARIKEGATTLDVEMWTTEKGCIEARLPSDIPSWLDIHSEDDFTLTSIDASDVTIHLEHMDRGHYSLVVSFDEVACPISLLASGYIKTRVVAVRDA